MLTEAFNRLRGELTMHGFEVEIQTAEGAISPENLAQRAESSEAVASVSFVRNEAYATADIKISDRVTGKTSIRTIATPAGTDSPSLLALRAVELLRSSLREFGPKPEPPKDIVGASPGRASPVVTEWAEGKHEAPAPSDEPPVLSHIATPVEVPYHVTMRADVVGVRHLSDASSAYGLGGAVGVSRGPNFEARVLFEAPWFGAKFSTARAAAQFHLITGFAEATYGIALGSTRASRAPARAWNRAGNHVHRNDISRDATSPGAFGLACDTQCGPWSQNRAVIALVLADSRPRSAARASPGFGRGKQTARTRRPHDHGNERNWGEVLTTPKVDDH